LNPWYEEDPDDGEDPDDDDEPSGAVVFTPQFYVECSGTVGATPDAGC
jgi:hypothetical protein